MRTPRRLFAGAAALLALSLTATACDASPTAARVNSQVIKQAALNAELRAWAGNTDYVSAFNSSNASSGLTVAGDAAGTYSSIWVANILSQIIDADVVHQRLVENGQTPTPAIDVAARSVSEISQIGWDHFSAGFRQTVSNRLAELATITRTSVATSTLLGVYNHYQPYFFSQVCTVEASAFTRGQAAVLAGGGVPNGTQSCYDQAQFEAQSPAFQTAIQALPVGKVAPPIPTSYGYRVVKVVSRDVQGFTPDVQRVLATAIMNAQGTANTVLNGLLAHARVQLNPGYGTWASSNGSFQVAPPASPSAGT